MGKRIAMAFATFLLFMGIGSRVNGDEIDTRSALIDAAHNRVFTFQRANSDIPWWDDIGKYRRGEQPSGMLSKEPERHNDMVDAGTLDYPADIAVDPSGNVWISDSGLNRVLRFNGRPGTDNKADLVIGQPDFSAHSPNRSGTRFGYDYPSQANVNTLRVPWSICFDKQGNLWVVDAGNNRVLRFSPPFANGMNADLVLGQKDFTSSSSNRMPEMENILQTAREQLKATKDDLVVISRYKAWVVDPRHKDVVPEENGPYPFLDLGKILFKTGEQLSMLLKGTPGPDTLSNPDYITCDTSGNMWVYDEGNRRLVRYSGAPANGMPADTIVGVQDLSSKGDELRKMVPSLSDLVSVEQNGIVWMNRGNGRRSLMIAPEAGDRVRDRLWTENTFYGVEDSLVVPKIGRLNKGDSVWVFASGKKARLVQVSELLVSTDAAKAFAENGGFDGVYHNKAQWDGFGRYYWAYKDELPERIAVLPDGTFNWGIGIKGMPGDAIIVDPLHKIAGKDKNERYRSIANAATNNKFTSPDALFVGKQYDGTPRHFIVELYAGLPKYDGSGKMQSIEITRLVLHNNQVIDKKEFSRETDVEERVGNGAPSLSGNFWAEDGSFETIGFVSTDKGKTWQIITISWGTESIRYEVNTLGLPPEAEPEFGMSYENAH